MHVIRPEDDNDDNISENSDNYQAEEKRDVYRGRESADDMRELELYGKIDSDQTPSRIEGSRSIYDHTDFETDQAQPPALALAPARAQAPAQARAQAHQPHRMVGAGNFKNDYNDHAELEISHNTKSGQHTDAHNPVLVSSDNVIKLSNALIEAFNKLKDKKYQDSSVMFYLDNVRLKLFKAENNQFYIEATESLEKTENDQLQQSQIRIEVTDLSDRNVHDKLKRIYEAFSSQESRDSLDEYHQNDLLVSIAHSGNPNGPVCYHPHPAVMNLSTHFGQITAIANQIIQAGGCSHKFEQFTKQLEKAKDDHMVQLPLLAQLFIIDHNNISLDFCQLRDSLKQYLETTNSGAHIFRNLLHIADSSLTEEAHNAKYKFENLDKDTKIGHYRDLAKVEDVEEINADNHVNAFSQFRSSGIVSSLNNISGFSIFQTEDKCEVSLLHKRTYVKSQGESEVTFKQEILTGDQAENFVRLVRLSSSRKYMRDCKMQSYHSSLFETTNINYQNDGDNLNLAITDVDQLDSRLALIDVLTQQNVNRSRSAQYKETVETAPSLIEKNQSSHKFSNPNLFGRSVQVGISCERIKINQVYVRRVYDNDDKTTPNIQWVVLKDDSGKPITDQDGNAGFVKVKFEDDGNISIDKRNIYLAIDNTSSKQPIPLTSAPEFINAFTKLEITAESCNVNNANNPIKSFLGRRENQSEYIYLKNSIKSNHSHEIQASTILGAMGPGAGAWPSGAQLAGATGAELGAGATGTLPARPAGTGEAGAELRAGAGVWPSGPRTVPVPPATRTVPVPPATRTRAEGAGPEAGAGQMRPELPGAWLAEAGPARPAGTGEAGAELRAAAWPSGPITGAEAAGTLPARPARTGAETRQMRPLAPRAGSARPARTEAAGAGLGAAAWLAGEVPGPRTTRALAPRAGAAGAVPEAGAAGAELGPARPQAPGAGPLRLPATRTGAMGLGAGAGPAGEVPDPRTIRPAGPRAGSATIAHGRSETLDWGVRARTASNPALYSSRLHDSRPLDSTHGRGNPR